MLVENCVIDTGDDDLCVKSGLNWYVLSLILSLLFLIILYVYVRARLGYTYGTPSKDILFRNITVYHGHGITVGSEMSAGVKNVRFENIRMKGTDLGIRIKSQRGRGGTVENIVYKDIVLEDVAIAVQVTLNYTPNLPVTNVTATPVFKDIFLHNVKAVNSRNAFDIEGLPESLIHNLSLFHVFVNATNPGLCEYAQLQCVDSWCPYCN